MNLLKKTIITSLLFLAPLSASQLSDLKQRYVDLTVKYNNGLVFFDEGSQNEETINDMKKRSPFIGGLNFPLKKATLREMQDRYLRLMKQTVRGVLHDRQNPETDKPNHSEIMFNLAYTHVSGEGFNTLRKLMEDLEARKVSGDFFEAGVWRGGSTIFMKAFIEAYGNKERKVWVADSFEGWPESDGPDGQICDNKKLPWIVVPLEAVKANFARLNLLDERVLFLKGWFKDTLPSAPVEKLALLRIDGDIYESTRDALEALYPKVAIGGYVLIDDYYYFPGCDRAVDEYREAHGITDQMFRQGPTCSGVYWKKTHD